MNRLSATGVVLAASVIAGPLAAHAAQVGSAAGTSDICTVLARLSDLSELPEGSGVVLSRRTPGLIWSHNDSGAPTLFALDASGAVKGRVRITGADVQDWEGVAAGPCPQGSCLYIADIGDNNRSRRQITVYRVPEPRAADTMTQPAERWQGIYPDGAHDAEALFITSAGQLYVVTKENANMTALYRFPQPAGGEVVRLQMVSKLLLADVTGADISADGEWVALRTNHELLFYRTRDLLSGARPEPRRFSLRIVGEPQGEGVAIGADGVIYLVGERGNGGTFASLRCTLR